MSKEPSFPVPRRSGAPSTWGGVTVPTARRRQAASGGGGGDGGVFLLFHNQ